MNEIRDLTVRSIRSSKELKEDKFKHMYLLYPICIRHTQIAYKIKCLLYFAFFFYIPLIYGNVEGKRLVQWRNSSL